MLLRNQVGLLARAPDFRRLFLARLTSEIGNWLSVIALSVVVYDTTGSATWVGTLLLAKFIPSATLGLILGPLADRLPRRRLLVVSDLINATIFCTLAFVSTIPVIIVLALLSGVASALFRPTVFAGLPNLVSKGDLPHANALISLAENGANLAGPVIAGVLLALLGPTPVFLFDGLTFLVSALILLRIPAAALQSSKSISKGHWRDVGDGLTLIFRERALYVILLSWGLASIGFSGINVAEVVFAKSDLDGGDVGFGILVASSGLGLVLGSVIAGPLITRRGVARVYWLALAAMSLSILAAAGSPALWIAAVFAVFFGVANTVGLIGNTTLIQQVTPDAMRGRVFTSLGSSITLALGLGMLAAGPVTSATSGRVAYALAAGVLALAALVAMVMIPSTEETLPETAGRDDRVGLSPGADPA